MHRTSFSICAHVCIQTDESFVNDAVARTPPRRPWRLSSPHVFTSSSDSIIPWKGTSVDVIAEAHTIVTQLSTSTESAQPVHSSDDLSMAPPPQPALPSTPSSSASAENVSFDAASPIASSPLPPSSVPVSPATSLGPSSPCKSPTSQHVSFASSPTALSPSSMTIDDPVLPPSSKPVAIVSSSPIELPSRLVASSPPPSSVLGKRIGSKVRYTMSIF